MGQQPQKKIPVKPFNLRAQQFINPLIDYIEYGALAVRRVEPEICSRLRAYLDKHVKIFYEIIKRDSIRFTNTLAGSKSTNVPEAARDIGGTDAATPTPTPANRGAYENATIDYSTEAYNILIEINRLCSETGSTVVMSQITNAMEQYRRDEIIAGQALANIPTAFETAMQANYAPLETIIGPRP